MSTGSNKLVKVRNYLLIYEFISLLGPSFFVKKKQTALIPSIILLLLLDKKLNFLNEKIIVEWNKGMEYKN